VSTGRQADVVVVGAGVVGLATAWALTRAGHEVVVLEQFRVGHARGSSHGSSRVFRFTYDEESWVRLAQEALPIWRELEAEAGVELLSHPGSLDTGRDPLPLCRALEACCARFEGLQPVEVERRFSVRLTEPAVFQPDGGVAWAERTLEALRNAVKVSQETRAQSLAEDGDSVLVETTAGSVEARAVVVCAGAWARSLLATAGIDLSVRVTRETVAYFALAGDGPVPSVIDWAVPEGWPGVQVYALDGGGGRLKIGLHHAGREADPDEDGTPDEAAVALAAGWAARTFQLTATDAVGAEACLYTSTADEGFVLERRGRIVVGSACSGHAFKFAPAVGSRLASLAKEALTS
jgi:sarcosine oxidase